MAHRYGLVIDLQLCMGCRTCMVACKMEHNLPAGVWWSRVLTDGGTGPDTFRGVYGGGTLRYIPLGCQHCENPACELVCPVGATYKDEETGIVLQNTDICIGCKTCISACPYTGVRTYLDGEPQYATAFPLGAQDAPAHYSGVVEKCTLCFPRVQRGEDPVCVASCPAYARHFGDLNDENSEVTQLINEHESQRFLTDRGTSPNVYYLL